MCVPFFNPSIDMYNMFLDEALSLRFRCFVGFIVSACVCVHIFNPSIDRYTDVFLDDSSISVFRSFIGFTTDTCWQVFHPNIDVEGKVCLNILRDEWKPVLYTNICHAHNLFSLLSLSLCIFSLLVSLFRPPPPILSLSHTHKYFLSLHLVLSVYSYIHSYICMCVCACVCTYV